MAPYQEISDILNSENLNTIYRKQLASSNPYMINRTGFQIFVVRLSAFKKSTNVERIFDKFVTEEWIPILCTLFISTNIMTFRRVKHFIWDTTPILPVLATIILAIIVFLLILFRQSPGVVAGTVAGCLIIIAVYLFLTSLSVAPKYE